MASKTEQHKEEPLEVIAETLGKDEQARLLNILGLRGRKPSRGRASRSRVLCLEKVAAVLNASADTAGHSSDEPGVAAVRDSAELLVWQINQAADNLRNIKK